MVLIGSDCRNDGSPKEEEFIVVCSGSSDRNQKPFHNILAMTALRPYFA